MSPSKWLLIEDDPNKAKQLLDFLSENYPRILIDIRKSYQSGLKAIFEEDYKVILLDMSLPTFDISAKEDGYIHKQLAGQEILQELKRKKKGNKVIVVTQFETFGEGMLGVSIDTLKDRLNYMFPSNYIGTVYYNAAQSTWKNELKKCLDETNAI